MLKQSTAFISLLFEAVLGYGIVTLEELLETRFGLVSAVP
jgi:hypothetical protein